MGQARLMSQGGRELALSLTSLQRPQLHHEQCKAPQVGHREWGGRFPEGRPAEPKGASRKGKIKSSSRVKGHSA